MDKRRGKRIAFQIFLSALFALLVTYIGFWVYDIVYRTGAFVSNESEDAAFACVGYVYDVRAASYEDGALTFELQNKKYSDYTISDIGILTDMGGHERVDVGRMQPGKAKLITIEIPLNNTFKVFPGECEMYGKLAQLEGSS